MKFEQPDNTRKNQWDQLVEQHGGGVFSLSTYLDATAENWEILWNDEYSGGIACPFTLKLGVKTLYAPFFHRFVQWIGEKEPESNDLLRMLQSRYRVAAAHIFSRNNFSFPTRVFQELNREGFKLNQQAKRMLKKAVDFSITQEYNPNILLELIREELTGKIAEIHDHSMQKLYGIVHGFKYPLILQFNLMQNGTWCGGIWILHFGSRVVYLKGSVTTEAREKGGMYKLMEHAIQFAFEHGATVDFGGSNAEGVRRFNTNWGGKDVSYYYFRWNNSPFWWKALQKGKHLWKK